MSKPVWIFYTGGPASTFRLVQLLREGQTVQPVYIQPRISNNEDRLAAAAVDDRMKVTVRMIRERLLEENPERILPAIIVNVDSIKVSDEVAAALRFLKIPFGPEQLLLTLITFSIHVGGRSGIIDYCGLYDDTQPAGILSRVRMYLDQYGYVRHELYPELVALRYLRFPLAVHTCITIQVQAKLEGWGSLLQLSDKKIEEILEAQRPACLKCFLWLNERIGETL